MASRPTKWAPVHQMVMGQDRMISAGGSLAERLGIEPGSCVALIGAGGKTTVMLRLAQDLASGGQRVLVTTTTKIWPPSRTMPILGFGQIEALSIVRGEWLTAGREIGPDGKIHGIEPDQVDRLVRENTADVVLCEADGAAGRPLKVHGPGEPMIPASATHVLVLAGMTVAAQAATPDTIHRWAAWERLMGSEAHGPVTSDTITRCLLEAARFAPSRAALTYVLNQVDGQSERDAACVVARLLGDSGPARIVLTHFGHLV